MGRAIRKTLGVGGSGGWVVGDRVKGVKGWGGGGERERER